jgi:hypothetical protein
MTLLRLAKRVASIVAACVLSGCGWDELDAVSPVLAAETANPPDATQGTGVPPQDATAPQTTAWPDDAGADGAVDEGGPVPEAGEPSDAATAGEEGVLDEASGELSALPCMGTQTVIRQWTFDSDTQGWTLELNTGVQGGLTWNDTMGDPSPGSLQVDITPNVADAGKVNGGWTGYADSFGDLSGRTLAAWVWLDQGVSPNLKLFVQTGSQWVWADNGVVILPSRKWTCVSLAVSAPSYNGPGYDPTSVVRIGFELLGPSPFRVFIDTVRYY